MIATRICKHPDCEAEVASKKRGRPRKYCDLHRSSSERRARAKGDSRSSAERKGASLRAFERLLLSSQLDEVASDLESAGLQPGGLPSGSKRDRLGRLRPRKRLGLIHGTFESASPADAHIHVESNPEKYGIQIEPEGEEPVTESPRTTAARVADDVKVSPREEALEIPAVSAMLPVSFRYITGEKLLAKWFRGGHKDYLPR